MANQATSQTAGLPLPIAPAPGPKSAAVWPAALFVALFWTLHVIVGHLDKPYFVGFLFNLGSSALLLLAYTIWWWANRRIRLVDRLGGFLLVVVGALIAEPFWHPSVGWFGLLTAALPLVLATATLWLIVLKLRPIAWSRRGTLLVVAATLASVGLVRIDGVDSDLQADFHWRWNPSAEDQFLAQQAGRAAERPAPGPTPALALRPGDWSEFRGAARDGVIHGPQISTDWNAQPPRLAWRQRVGPAWSSVVVVDGRLFTQEQRGDREAVVCYDAHSGRCLWTHDDAARFWESVSGAGPRATPTFADGRIYALGGTGILNCLDAATGKLHWTRNIAADAGAAVPQWGFSGSPLVVDALVIAFAGGAAGHSLAAYRADTGEPVWTAPAGTLSYSSPQLATLAGCRQCLLLADEGLTAVEPHSGAALWKIGAVMHGAPRSVQPHALGPGQLLVGTLDGYSTTLVEVARDGDAWRAERRWTSKDLKPEFPDFVVHQGHAYGFDVNIFCCIDLASGKRCWKAGRYGRGQVVLLADQSLLLVAAENGAVVLLAANPQQPQELGRFPALDGKTWNHPVVVGQKLYIRNAEELACYTLPSPPAHVASR